MSNISHANDARVIRFRAEILLARTFGGPLEGSARVGRERSHFRKEEVNGAAPLARVVSPCGIRERECGCTRAHVCVSVASHRGSR